MSNNRYTAEIVGQDICTYEMFVYQTLDGRGNKRTAKTRSRSVGSARKKLRNVVVLTSRCVPLRPHIFSTIHNSIMKAAR